MGSGTKLIVQFASKVVVLVVLGLLVATGAFVFDQHQLVRLDAMAPEQIVAHERVLHSHSLFHHFVMYLVLLGIAVGIIEGVSWCIRWPFIYWMKESTNRSHRAG
jgi:hypothetical protein